MRIGVVMYQTSFTKGQELLAQRMTKELIKQGRKAFLIAGPYHDNEVVPAFEELGHSVEPYLFREESEFQVPLIRVDGYVSTWPPRRIMFRDFLSALRRISTLHGVDVIICHSTLWNGPEEIAKFITWKRLLRAQGMNEREVLFGHMPHYQPPDPGFYSVAERALRVAWNTMVFPQVFQTADVVLCTTPIEEESLVTLGANRERCLLYPGGVDEESFMRHWGANPRDLLEKHSVPADAKIVTYMGTIEDRKNPLAVVRIARMMRGMRGVHFVIAGFPSNQDRQVREESRGLANLSYLGVVSEAEKVALIKSSYVNLLMSRLEAFGLTQLEFMYGGVPVVTSAIGGQRWLVRDRLDGIHLRGPDDLKGAVESISTLISNPELRDGFSKNARMRASDFTLEKVTSALLTRLDSTLGR